MVDAPALACALPLLRKRKLGGCIAVLNGFGKRSVLSASRYHETGPPWKRVGREGFVGVERRRVFFPDTKTNYAKNRSDCVYEPSVQLLLLLLLGRCFPKSGCSRFREPPLS